MAETEVSIIFKGVDEVSKTVTEVGKGLQSFSGNLQDITGPLASLNQTILLTEAALGAMAIVVGTISFNAAKEYETALVGLQKVLSDTEQDTTAFEATIQQLSATFGINQSVLLEAATNFRIAGFSIQESLELTEVTLSAVIAGNIEAAQASLLLQQALLGFQADASQAAGIVDLLNQIANNFGVTFSELLQGFVDLSPAANAANLSFEQTAALLTPVIEVFGSGSEAARGLRTVLLQLTDGADSTVSAFETLGVSQTDANGNFREGFSVLEDLAAAFQEVDATQALFLAGQIAGANQATKFLALLNNFEKTLEIAGEGFEYVGSSANEVARVLDTSKVAVDRFAAAINGLLAAIGSQFQDEMKGVINAGGDLTRVFQQLVQDGAFSAFFDALQPKLVELESLLKTIAENLPEALGNVDFTRLVESLGEVGLALGGLFDFDLSTPEGLTRIIQLIVDGLAVLNEIVAGSLGAMSGLTLAMQGFIEGGVKLDSSIFNLIGQILGWSQVLDFLLPKLDTLLLAIIAIGPIATGLGAAFGLASGALSALVPTTLTAATAVATLAGPLALGALAAGMLLVAPAIGAAGGAIAIWALETTGLDEPLKRAISGALGLADASNKLEEAHRRTVEETDALVEELQALNAEYQAMLSYKTDVSVELVNQAEAYEKTGKAVNLTADELDALTEQLEIQKRVMATVVDDTKYLGGAMLDLGENATLAERKLVEMADKQADAYNGFLDSIEQVKDAQAGLIPLTDELIAVWRSATFQQEVFGVASAEAAAEMKKFGIESDGLSAIVENTDNVIAEFVDGVVTITQVSKGAQDANRSTAETLEDLADAGEIAKDKYAELRTEIEKEEIKARVALDIAELESQTELAKAQIQGIVDIAQIKATIEIADIEAETERIIAAFGSIDNTVIQTSDTIRSLADALVGIDDADRNAREKIRILEDVLDRQLSVQEAAVDSQVRLNDATIESLRARTDRLRQGDALIQIDGAGLQPELEAFMFRILENVQIRANAEGQEFLLGI